MTNVLVPPARLQLAKLAPIVTAIHKGVSKHANEVWRSVRIGDGSLYCVGD